MGTVEDIKLDVDYLRATYRFLLLNDHYPIQIGPSPVIVLSHADLMTFIHVFHDLIQCQQNIHKDNRRMITLFISNTKLTEWNNQINITDNNIDKIYIFCQTFSDYMAMKQWNGCYKNKVQDVYLHDTLEYKLMQLGIDYIHQVMPEFREDRGIYRKFVTDAQNLIRALNSYFQDKIDSLDDSPSVENQ